jgi:hypothetical protein
MYIWQVRCLVNFGRSSPFMKTVSSGDVKGGPHTCLPISLWHFPGVVLAIVTLNHDSRLRGHSRRKNKRIPELFSDRAFALTKPVLPTSSPYNSRRSRCRCGGRRRNAVSGRNTGCLNYSIMQQNRIDCAFIMLSWCFIHSLNCLQICMRSFIT